MLLLSFPGVTCPQLTTTHLLMWIHWGMCLAPAQPHHGHFPEASPSPEAEVADSISLNGSRQEVVQFHSSHELVT